MKKIIVSAFALVLFATVSYAQDVKKSQPTNQQNNQQTAQPQQGQTSTTSAPKTDTTSTSQNSPK